VVDDEDEVEVEEPDDLVELLKASSLKIDNKGNTGFL
jgi:hypothetical protein